MSTATFFGHAQEGVDLSNLDDRDTRIVTDRITAYWKRNDRPQTGDFIRFSDGVTLRIAYVWRDEGWTGNAQTEDGAGSYHLGEHGLTMSGSLDDGVPVDKLKPTYETEIGSAWIFHHGHAGAGRGRSFRVPFNVWAYDGPSSDAGYQPPAVIRRDGVTTYSRLHAASLDRDMHERTCGYWYTVTCGAMSHTAFATRAGLDQWLSERGLRLENDLPDGENGHSRIVGSYRECSHSDPAEFAEIRPVIETSVLSNGEYTLGLIDEDASGVRTIHYLAAYVKTRQVFDYQRTREQMS